MALRRLVERTNIDSNYTGLSTDEKPTENVGINSLFLELDTGDFYYLSSAAKRKEETVFDDTIELDSSLEGAMLGVITLADTITAVFDGIEYANLQKQTNSFYGATWDESTQSVDYSVYPFRVHYQVGFSSSVQTESAGEHTISIYSNNELVVEKTFNAYYLGQAYLDLSRALRGDIKFVIGEEEYACEQQTDQYRNEYYGAPTDENGYYDFSVYPFRLSPDGSLVLSKPTGEYHISVTENIVTKAVWKKVGGNAPSPTPSGDLLFEATLDDWDYLEEQGMYVQNYSYDQDSLPNHISVLWDGVSYECDSIEGMYGAPMTDQGIDFSQYPFSLMLDDDTLAFASPDNNAHTVAIYGEISPSPDPVEGDLENGVTIQPSAWVDGKVDVPFFNMQTGKQYELLLDGESIMLGTAQRDEITGGIYVSYDIGTEEVNPNSLSFTSVSDENTTHVEWTSPPSTAVTIRLAWSPIG